VGTVAVCPEPDGHAYGPMPGSATETRIATHTSKSVPAVAPTGCAVLLVEQRALEALRISDYGYILVGGAVEVEAPAAQLLERQDIGEIFLGRAYPQPAGA
jgi:branched-chain amino acid transport system ATP-binding protein